MNTVEFPPEGTYEFADIVERLVSTGYLKTESVGFLPTKWEDGDGDKGPSRTYIKQELLEISIVPVPSNPDALRNAVNDGVITTKQFEAITKAEEPKVVEVEPKDGYRQYALATTGDIISIEVDDKANDVSQEQIIDEMDYLIRLIETEGMNEEVERDAWQLVREILRLSGGDIPVDIKESFTVEVIKYEPPPQILDDTDIFDAIRKIVKI